MFTNENVLFSWFTSYNDVQIVTKEQLAQHPLGNNISFKPRSQMVKFVSSPKVYAVAIGGVLRHIASESVAEGLYGCYWNLDVYDILESLSSNYKFGDTIYEVGDFDV